jgi:RNA polymerase sigma factor (sigma-70 family)
MHLPPPPEPDLSRLADAELVRLAQAQGPAGPAAAALFQRHYPALCRRAARLARAVGLPQSYLADAQHEAVLGALPQAIARYDPAPEGMPGHCTFRTFLGLIVRARLSDFARKVRRAERHLDRSARVVDALGTVRGPEAAAENRELQAKVAEALRHVNPTDRWLWEESLAGTPLTDLARQLGVPYHQAKRRRQAVRAYLAAQLKEWAA